MSSGRLRVATYNILVGGGGRWSEIRELVRAMDADVLALQETEEEAPVRALGDALGYQVLFATAPSPRHQSVLTRLPVQRWSNHRDPDIFLRNSIEAWLEAPPGSVYPTVRLHTVHLTAAFQRRGRAEPERLRELEEVRRHAEQQPQTPSLVLGDFNSLAPGDRVRATDFFAQLERWRREGQLETPAALAQLPAALTRLPWWPQAAVESATAVEALPEAVRVGLPRLPWLVHPLLEALPRGDTTDAVLGALLPRAAVRSMLAAGYLDCLRQVHPRGDHFTCPTYQPAVRIDYIFMDPRWRDRLRSCEVVGRHGALARLARRASDHYPVLAEFDLGREAVPGRQPGSMAG